MSNFIALLDKALLKEIMEKCLDNVTLTQEKAKRFFKTSENTYAANEKFLGITVPNLRKIAKIYRDVNFKVIEELLKSKYNEKRLLALFILVHQYKNGNFDHQEKICKFYISNMNYVNNWNLVDSSAHHILGHYLYDKDRSLLIKLAKSDILWARRISIVATWYFIRRNDVFTTFELAKLFFCDKEDLVHKAVGWMLREAGKKNKESLLEFLSKYEFQMPRTMLRYSKEKC